MLICTNSLPSLTVELPRHSWPPDALSIWPSNTLINSLGSACVLRDFYVDDMLTGADIVDELNSRWNYSTIKIRSIRVKQMGLELPWIIRNRQSCVGVLSEIMLRTHVFWACNGISVRICFSANLIQNLTLYQNESYFPRSLNFSIL